MKIILAAAFVLGLAVPSHALVWQIWNDTPYKINVKAHNTQAGCADYKRTLDAKTGFTQMDWRGGCTASCADWIMIQFDMPPVSGYCYRYELTTVTAQCSNKKFHITAPKDGYPTIGGPFSASQGLDFNCVGKF